jgi:hypothetical protein
MQIPTHILSGWCAANLFPLTPRQRLLAMIAATIPDLDGLSLLGGQEAYWHYHHRVCHNLAFAILTSLALAAFSRVKTKKSFAQLAALYLTLFHLHLNMDVFGSGPGWGIHYLWPFSNWMFDNTHYSWPFQSWQNLTIFLLLFAWTILIALRRHHTPLELLAPDLNRRLLGEKA